jgi:hypothetical protein
MINPQYIAGTLSESLLSEREATIPLDVPVAMSFRTAEDAFWAFTKNHGVRSKLY